MSAAAAELALISSAEDFTISALARRAGLAKGTVYLYFNNKTAILMALLGDAVETLMHDVTARLLKLPEPATAEKVARALRDCLRYSATSRRLVRLLKSLSDEVSGRSHQEFQQRIHPLIEKLDGIIIRKLPGLRPGEGAKIMSFSWALLLACPRWPRSIPRSRDRRRSPVP
ncbi:MAG: TetR/AcrR family transcriptional regulator [Verrucomicrobiota bacterium]